MTLDWPVPLTPQGAQRWLAYVLTSARLADTATQGQIVIGINHSTQVSDDRRTFYAGALRGLGGGALLSAVQEALSRFES